MFVFCLVWFGGGREREGRKKSEHFLTSVETSRKKREKKIRTCLPAVQADALDPPPRRQQHRAPGRLVHSARLHPDEARLDDVDAPDAVVARDLVFFLIVFFLVLSFF